MFLVVIRCQAVAAPLNSAYTDEFEFYLSDSESKLLVTSVEGKKAAQAAAAKLPAHDTKLISSLAAGGAVTLPSAERFSATTFWSDMKKSKATWYNVVPTIHQIILNCHLSSPEPYYLKLRFIRSYNSSLAPSILECLGDSFKAPVLEVYAMKEASHLMCSKPLPEDGVHKPESIGKLVGQELAILNENGLVQGPGKNGEVCIWGPNVTKGYKSNLEATSLPFSLASSIPEISGI